MKSFKSQEGIVLSQSKGFTLVEMLIVIAIIAILASVALVSVRGVRSSANDTKRISDLNKVQQTLEIYYTKNGEYPSSATFVAMATAIGLTQAPTDPSADRAYGYSVEPGHQHYILSAQLENDSKILDDSNELDVTTNYTGDAVCTEGAANAAPYGYCVGN